MSHEKEQKLRLQQLQIKNRRAHRWLIFALLVEGFILLLLNPGFFGPGAFYSTMVTIGSYIDDAMCFRGDQDLGTYRYYIHSMFQWIEGLEIYPFICALLPWVVPGWFGLTILRHFIYKFSIAYINRPPKKRDRSATMVSGLYEAEKKAATERFEQLRVQCNDPFRGDQGIRVQGRTDYVKRWDSNNRILLEDVAIGKLHLALRDGQAYLETSDGWIPLQKGVPMVFRYDNRGGETIIQSALIWLGGEGS